MGEVTLGNDVEATDDERSLSASLATVAARPRDGRPGLTSAAYGDGTPGLPRGIGTTRPRRSESPSMDGGAPARPREEPNRSAAASERPRCPDGVIGTYRGRQPQATSPYVSARSGLVENIDTGTPVTSSISVR